ncbi:uronyl 2-sulfotransferase-like [Glandiceps talaboti]
MRRAMLRSLRTSCFRKLFKKRRVVILLLLLVCLILSTAILFTTGKGHVNLRKDILFSLKKSPVRKIDGTLLDIDLVLENVNNKKVNISSGFLSPSTGLPLNLSRTWNETRVIYNRVDKSGSRSLLYTFRRLRDVNGFIHNQSTEWLKPNLTLQEQRDFVTEILSLTSPFIYDRHVHYMDFEMFGVSAPSWINMIREPLPRLVSRYYFKRYGDEFRSGPRMGFNGTEEDVNRSFDDCVLSDHPECSVEGGFLIIPYFCGHEPACQKPSRWALERAQMNVLEKFAFVGVLEDFNSTLIILERMFPQFFSGMFRTYKHVKHKFIKYRSSTKIETSSIALTIMKSRLSLEYEFYNFVKERLELIKQQLGIDSPTTTEKELTSKNT